MMPRAADSGVCAPSLWLKSDEGRFVPSHEGEVAFHQPSLKEFIDMLRSFPKVYGSKRPLFCTKFCSRYQRKPSSPRLFCPPFRFTIFTAPRTWFRHVCTSPRTIWHCISRSPCATVEQMAHLVQCQSQRIGYGRVTHGRRIQHNGGTQTAQALQLVCRRQILKASFVFLSPAQVTARLEEQSVQKASVHM
jgi:hypothetical protein